MALGQVVMVHAAGALPGPLGYGFNGSSPTGGQVALNGLHAAWGEVFKLVRPRLGQS